MNYTHNPSITKYLPVPMPLPGSNPNLCLNEKGGKFEFDKITKIAYHMMRLHEEITMQKVS
jgi:hypothetical protein